MIRSQLTFNDMPEAMAALLDQVERIEEKLLSLTALPAVKLPDESPINQKELSRFLGLSEQTIIRWKKRKKIPFIQNGSTVRFFLSDVLKSLNKS